MLYQPLVGLVAMMPLEVPKSSEQACEAQLCEGLTHRLLLPQCDTSSV